MNILNTKYLPRLRIIHIWQWDAANPEFSRLLLAAHEKYAALSADEMRSSATAATLTARTAACARRRPPEKAADARGEPAK